MSPALFGLVVPRVVLGHCLIEKLANAPALIDFFSGCLYNQFFRDALKAIDHEQHGDMIVGLPQLRFGQGQGQADLQCRCEIYRNPGPRFRSIGAPLTEDEEQRHLQEKHQPPRMQKRQPAKIAIALDAVLSPPRSATIDRRVCVLVLAIP